MNVAFLGSIPIDPKIGVDSDKGEPFIIAQKNSAATKTFLQIVEKIQANLKN
jgi:MinD-like ATPase involved in chromosome partitioning or flagellar assembly